MPKIYFFDMDNTLIDNDCDILWKSFVVEQKLAPPDALERAMFYYKQYEEGKPVMNDFMDFHLQEFIGKSEAEMEILAQLHFETWIKKNIYTNAMIEVKRVQSLGVPTVLLTASNTIIAQPVAKHIDFDACLATKLELKDGYYTGKLAGEYVLGVAKIAMAQEYCKLRNLSLADAAYYGDSINDVPILKTVGFPVAANPCAKLKAEAMKHNWPIIRFN